MPETGEGPDASNEFRRGALLLRSSEARPRSWDCAASPDL